MTFNVSKLPNNITLLSFEMPYLQSIAINIIVKVGSRNELQTESGISHFLEHMAFKGTKTKTAKQIAEKFDAIGGDFNAYTGREKTVYYAKLLKEHFSIGLDILADILQNSLFEHEDIQKEYKVICQEIAQMQDNPEDLGYEFLLNSAYAGQPLGNSILGTEESISQFDEKSFRQYLDKHYTGENIYISVAGNVSHQEILTKISDSFSNIQAQKSILCEPAKYIGGISKISKDLEQTTFLLGFESVPYLNQEQLYSTQMLSLIFGGGFSSRLFQRIREELGLVYSVGSYNISYSDTGLFSIYAGTEQSNLPELIDNIAVEIKKIINFISDDELVRAKSQFKASILMAEEKSGYKSEEIGKNYAIFKRYISTEEIIEKIMNVSRENIYGVAQSIFSSKLTISAVGKGLEDINLEDIHHKINQ